MLLGTKLNEKSLKLNGKSAKMDEKTYIIGFPANFVKSSFVFILCAFEFIWLKKCYEFGETISCLKLSISFLGIRINGYIVQIRFKAFHFVFGHEFHIPCIQISIEVGINT